jgi:NAD+ synthase (glutamine-hydrolysing)
VQTLDLARQGDVQKVALMIFPELGISAYAIDDLLFQDTLLDRVEAAVADITAASRDLPWHHSRHRAQDLSA